MSQLCEDAFSMVQCYFCSHLSEFSFVFLQMFPVRFQNSNEMIQHSCVTGVARLFITVNEI